MSFNSSQDSHIFVYKSRCDFKRDLGFKVEKIRRAWAYYKISMVSALRNSIVLNRESRLTGSVFKILDTRQSEIFIESRRSISFNSSQDSQSLFTILKRFSNVMLASKLKKLSSLGLL